MIEKAPKAPNAPAAAKKVKDLNETKEAKEGSKEGKPPAAIRAAAAVSAATAAAPSASSPSPAPTPTPVVAGPRKEAWAKKTWLTALAPSFFGGKEVGEVPAAKQQDVVGRTLIVPLNELTGNLRHYQTAVRLKISRASDGTAETEYYGQELVRDAVARLIRRWSSRIDVVKDVKTRDGKTLRLKVLVVTARKVKAGIQTKIRNAVSELAAEQANGKTLEEIVVGINMGKFLQNIASQVRKIYPIRALEARRIDVLSSG